MELSEYPIRICVAGSRSFHDSYLFDIFLRAFLSWAGIGQYAFISGDAWRGADRMIIDWADDNNVPCFKFPADWDQFGKSAGFIRNAEMRTQLTHLLVFWDGESRGTREMIEKTMKIENTHVSVVLVRPDAAWVERESKRKEAAANPQFSKKRFKAKNYDGQPQSC